MKRDHVEIVEVGPRDGLQNETLKLDLQARFGFIKHLAVSGLKRIEVGAFVSPAQVPQMAGSRELISELFRRAQEFPAQVRFSALVPNARGMEEALQTPIPEVAIFGACSESFAKRNINCTIAESFERFKQVAAMAKVGKRLVRGYLSMAFGCPYEGRVPEDRVVELACALLKLGVHEISLGDTIGVATPLQVRSLITRLKRKVPLRKIALHLHNTRGTALANVLEGLQLGVRVFDSTFGGIGGCPYAKGASGNLATDDLVYMLHGMELATGVNLETLLTYGPTIVGQIGHNLHSRLSEAGLPKFHETLLNKRRPQSHRRTK